MAENILYSYDNAVDIVVAMIVDDGVEHRGNRLNRAWCHATFVLGVTSCLTCCGSGWCELAPVFNPDFTVVGIATGPHKDCEHVCVIDMAMTFTEGKARDPRTAPLSDGR